MSEKKECEHCGEIRYTFISFHGNVCHPCLEELEDMEENENDE